MPITCTVRTEQLRDALGLCGMVLKKRSPNPAALAYHVRPGPVGIEVFATDFQASVGVGVASDVSVSFSTPGDRFAAAVDSIDTETATLVRDGERLVVSSNPPKGRQRDARTFRLTAADPLDTRMGEPTGTPIAIDGTDLAEAIDRVEFAANRGDTADWKNGVNFAPSDAGLTLTACDTRKFSSVRLSAVAKDGEPCVLSTGYAVAVAKLVEGGDATLHVDGRGVVAQAGDRWISCPAFQTKYPDTSYLFAGRAGSRAVVDRDRLIREVQAAAIVLGQTEAQFGVALTFSRDGFTAKGLAGVEDTATGGPAECSGEFSFVANYRFLIDCLRHAKGETVTLVDGRNGGGIPNVQINPDGEHRLLVQPLDVKTASPAAA